MRITCAAVLVLASVSAAGAQPVITPLMHASVQIESGSRVIQVDPWSAGDLSRAKPADLILITDDPIHHLDPKAIQRLRKPNAPVVVPVASQSKFADGTPLANGESRTLAGIHVEAIAAYDIKPGEPSHPKGKANGYVVTVGGTRLYFAGVTECVPEIRALRNIDIAFLPMNLPLDRMLPSATADCVKAFAPKAVYVYHYDQNYATRLTNPNGRPPAGGPDIAASLRTLRDLLVGLPVEFKDGDWYPPIPQK
jgi:L-ascorbate metabolism protein UlaG (beta-lactamase superfamily)